MTLSPEDAFLGNFACESENIVVPRSTLMGCRELGFFSPKNRYTHISGYFKDLGPTCECCGGTLALCGKRAMIKNGEGCFKTSVENCAKIVLAFPGSVLLVTWCVRNGTSVTARVVHCTGDILVNTTFRGVAAVASSSRIKYSTISYGSPKCHCLGSLSVCVERNRLFHTPGTSDLTGTLLDYLEPGKTLWATRVGDGEWHAFVYDERHGGFGCIHPDCHGWFTTLREWARHYPIPACSRRRYGRVTVADTRVYVDYSVQQPCDGKYGSGAVNIAHTFRSLCDPCRGLRLRQKLFSKLEALCSG